MKITYTQEVIDYINKLVNVNLNLIKNGKCIENWKELKKLKKKRKEVIEYIRKSSGVH